jgi:hypothetical protein
VTDEEGIDLPNRSAAREEAMAAARELSDRASGRLGRRWAGWFLQVADQHGGFLRVPLGYPALELVSAGNPRLMAAGPQPVAAADQPASAIRASRAGVPSQTGGVLVIVRGMLERRRQTERLLQKNQELRRELAKQFLVSQTASVRARELLKSAQAAYSQTIELQASRGGRADP